MAASAPTTGLVALFRADSLSAVAGGASVTSWVDSVGSRTLVTRGAAPTKLASGAGSQPAVRFNGTSQSLGMSSPPAVPQPYTLVLIATMSGSLTGTTRQALWQGSGGEVYTDTTGKWANDGGAPRLGSGAVTNNPTVVTSVFNTDSSDSRMYVNGVLDSATTNVGTGAMDQGILIMGNNFYSTSRWWQGDIYEVRFYDHVLSSSERAQLHTYVQDRYGITVADYVSADTTAPTITSFTTTPGDGQVALAWAGTDDTGITGWTLKRGSTTVYSGTGTSYVDTGRTNGTALTYTLTASDAAGNVKTATATATPTAPAAATGRVLDRWSGSALVRQRLDRWSGSALVARTIELATGSTGSLGFPQALGSLTARPSWTNAAAAAGPLDQPPVSTRTRTLTLPNMPAPGGDILAAWTAYFGDRVGNLGTKQPGDRLLIPGGLYRYSGNLDIPDHCSDIEIVLGTEGNPTILRSSQLASGLVTQHGLRVLGAADIRIRGASATTQSTIETAAVAGRTGLNQQGNTMLLLDPGTTGFYGQDLILRGARAAGFFAYRADNYWLNRVTVEDSLADAFHNTNGSTYGIFTDCVSRRCGDDGWAVVYYDGGALSSQSHHIEVYRHVVDGNGHGRGFANIGCPDIYADQVIIRGSAAASVIVDREASTGGTAHGSIARVLLQRFLIQGGNWSEQDHGSVFVRNGINNGTVDTVVLESFEIRDAAPNRQIVRALGDGSTATVLDVTMTDFQFTGGLGGDQFGGNNLSRIVRNGWGAQPTSTGTETQDPTLVLNTPGQYATVTGTLTGTTTDTSAMRNTQAIQFYAGDAGTKVSGVNVTGVDTVQIKVGSTVLGTVSGSALDAAKRGAQVWDTAAFANGPARITLTATDQGGRTKVVTRDVVIANSTPGSLAGMP